MTKNDAARINQLTTRLRESMDELTQATENAAAHSNTRTDSPEKNKAIREYKKARYDVNARSERLNKLLAGIN